MAVVSVTTLTVKPDRYEDFLETTRKAKTILEKSGARNLRLLAALTAGEATGSLAMTWEVDDFSRLKGPSWTSFWPIPRDWR